LPQIEVLTVSQLNLFAKRRLETDAVLSDVFAAGEISNFKAYPQSGHWYFALKDRDASIPAVMFRGSNQRLLFLPENGMRVVVRGHVSIYERDGKFQLYAQDMQPSGIGALYLALAQLKEKLEAEGLFDPSRKKPIPQMPRCVGVVTSGSGAAVQDVLQILARRFPPARVILCPVQVQGDGSAAQIARAIERLNRDGEAEVLIVGRGGGSMEDLWAFNEEPVIRAVASSKIPVISAVGHETDHTLCDDAADLRAPTPSAAAELAVPDQQELFAFLRNVRERSKQAVLAVVRTKRFQLDYLLQARVLRGPDALLTVPRQRIDDAQRRAHDAMNNRLQAERRRYYTIVSAIDAMSPLRVLTRGYAIVTRGGHIAASAAELKAGDEVEIQLRDGSRTATIAE
jgi:exodeoxyribonuclease VII large subunit